jgi:hypothetical protein
MPPHLGSAFVSSDSSQTPFKANIGNCEEFPLAGSPQHRYLESVTPNAGEHTPEDDAMEG